MGNQTSPSACQLSLAVEALQSQAPSWDVQGVWGARMGTGRERNQPVSCARHRLP